VAISLALLTSDGSTTDQASYDTASISPAGNRLLLLFCDASSTGGVEPSTPTVTGNGLTWVLEDSVWYKTTTNTIKLFCFRAMGASPSAGAVTIDFGSTHTGTRWDVLELDGVDTSGTSGSGAVRQSEVASGTIALGVDLTVTLAAAGASGNRAVAGFGTNSSTANSLIEGAGWTEISDDAHASPSQTLQTQWNPDTFDTSVTATQNSGTLTTGGIALEIVAATAPPPTPPIQVAALRPMG